MTSESQTRPAPSHHDDRQTVARAERWLARLALLSALAAAVLLVVVAINSPGILAVGLAGLIVTLAGGWWFISRRGVVRWIAAVFAVAAPIAVLVVYLTHHLVWQILLVAALAALATGAARAAVVLARPPAPLPETPVPPPRHPYVIMNPRSGGGKVRSFGLDTKASDLGATVALLEGPGHVDVAQLARDAVAYGADLLGVAGGDGTQALVAGIAAENDLPFLVISAGTRNHFAMDLGLDREHPDTGLQALTDGVEIRVDLGDINGRTFVNNASFGAYAQVVQSPAYRDDKRGTTLQMLPDLLSGHQGPRLRVRVDGREIIEGAQAILVSNNPYEFGDPAGLGRRPRLDGGVLGVVAVTVTSAAEAVDLLRGRRGRGLYGTTAHEVVVDSDADQIPVGIDGEAVLMPTPVHCTIRPLALRVRLPGSRPGVPAPVPRIDHLLLLHQAMTVSRVARTGAHAAR